MLTHKMPGPEVFRRRQGNHEVVSTAELPSLHAFS
jgi:hypothetical protein